jgi:hypothetical protein
MRHLISIFLSISPFHSFIFRNRINLTYHSSTHTPPPRTPLSTSTTRETSILLALAGEAVHPHPVEVVVVEEVVAAAVVRDLVRGAWDVWMMFVRRSVGAANRRTGESDIIAAKMECQGEEIGQDMDRDVGV